MRRALDAGRIREFMASLGQEATTVGRLYFTGGASAVLVGWRQSTVDVDIKLDPETDPVFRALPRLKERLEMNVELAAPDQFIPELPGWQERSVFISQQGRLTYLHYDFYAQALSKIQRGHDQDRQDVREMIERGLVEKAELRRLFEAIEPQLYRFPAIDPAAFRAAVEAVLGEKF